MFWLENDWRSFNITSLRLLTRLPGKKTDCNLKMTDSNLKMTEPLTTINLNSLWHSNFCVVFNKTLRACEASRASVNKASQGWGTCPSRQHWHDFQGLLANGWSSSSTCLSFYKVPGRSYWIHHMPLLLFTEIKNKNGYKPVSRSL